jgi:hypothetical protein
VRLHQRWWKTRCCLPDEDEVADNGVQAKLVASERLMVEMPGVALDPVDGFENVIKPEPPIAQA